MKYRSDIDGLRALAVISVLFSHLSIPYFRGGYVGVDIFFVISGFLITSIIVTEIKEKQFSIINFYERRIRRIFPALFFMMFLTTLVAYYILLPGHFKDYGQSIVAATLFIANILFWKESGYFSEVSATKPLLHTWTLGVEEQFYIFFPLLLLLVYRYFKGRWSIWIMLISVLSFILSIYMLQVRPTGTFFLLPTRAWEFLIGALLSLGVFPKITYQKIALSFSLAGLFLIVYAVVVFSKETVFPGMAALVPVLGAFLIIYAGTYYRTIVSNILSFPPIVFIGLISYSLYLYHWPMIAFVKYYQARELNSNEIWIILVLSFILAIFSWKYIESPFRKKNLLKDRRKLFTVAFSVMLLMVIVGGVIYRTKGYPKRIDESIRNLIINNELAKTNWKYPDKYNNFRNPLKKINDMHYYVMGKETNDEILFWGDSHIGMLFPAIESIYKSNKIDSKIVLGTSGGCLPIRGFNRTKKGYFCNRFNDLLYKKAQEKTVKKVIIGSRWDYYGNSLNKECKENGCSNILSIETVRSQFQNDIEKLIQQGKEVYIILPFPRYNDSVPLTLERKYWFSKMKVISLSHKLHNNYKDLNKIDQILKQIALKTGAKILDPKSILCSQNDICIYEKNGVSIYRDTAHLNTNGAMMMIDMLENIFKEENKRE